MFAPPEGYGDLATRSFAAGRGVLAARRALRGALLAFGFGAAFAAGFVAGTWRSGASREREPEFEIAGDSPSAGRDLPEAVEPDVFAVESRAAEAGLADRVRLLIEAGDRHLSERRDVLAAARCYRDALTAADAAGLGRPEARGNWLASAMFAEEP